MDAAPAHAASGVTVDPLLPIYLILALLVAALAVLKVYDLGKLYFMRENRRRLAKLEEEQWEYTPEGWVRRDGGQ